jgi:Tfp pilus assembly protein PilP
MTVIFCAAFLAAGCGGSSEPPAAQQPGAQAGGTASGETQKSKNKGKAGTAEAPSTPEAQAAVLEEQVKTWKYDPTNKWDPFIAPPPPVELTGPDSNRYDLDQMLLLGVVHGSESMSAAYIRLPNGKDKIVQIGDIIGKHGGELKEIGKDFILVEEKYMDPQHPNDTFIIEKELKLKSAPKK